MFSKDVITNDDEKALINTALHSDAAWERMAALLEISDEDTLIEVALYDKDPDVRMVAVSKIDDGETLLYIAENDEFPDVREAATDKIDDGKALRSIMEHDEAMGVQRAALQKLMEQEPDLLPTLLSDENERVRRLAVERITDDKTLLEISKKDSSVRVRITALHVMSNTGRLMEVLQNDPDSSCRHAAFRRLLELSDQLSWEQNMILRIMERDGKDWLYRASRCPFCGGKHLSGYSWEEDYDFTMYTQWDCEECKECYVECDDLCKEIQRVKRIFGLKR